MDATRLLAVFVLGCAATACAFDVAPDSGDGTAPASATTPPINTGAARDPHRGTNCMPLVTYDPDAGLVATGGYVCSKPSTRLPDPASAPPTELPAQLAQGLTSPR